MIKGSRPFHSLETSRRPSFPFPSFPICSRGGGCGLPWASGNFFDPLPRFSPESFLLQGPGYILPSVSTAGCESQRSKGHRLRAGERSPPRGPVCENLRHNWPSEQPAPKTNPQGIRQALRDAGTHSRTFLDSGLALDLGVPGNGVHPAWGAQVLTQTLLSPLTVAQQEAGSQAPPHPIRRPNLK